MKAIVLKGIDSTKQLLEIAQGWKQRTYDLAKIYTQAQKEHEKDVEMFKQEANTLRHIQAEAIQEMELQYSKQIESVKEDLESVKSALDDAHAENLELSRETDETMFMLEKAKGDMMTLDFKLQREKSRNIALELELDQIKETSQEALHTMERNKDEKIDSLSLELEDIRQKYADMALELDKTRLEQKNMKEQYDKEILELKESKTQLETQLEQSESLRLKNEESYEIALETLRNEKLAAPQVDLEVEELDSLSLRNDSMERYNQLEEELQKRKLEIEQDNALLRASLVSLEEKAHDLKDELSESRESEKTLKKSLELAKMAHHQLLLQIDTVMTISRLDKELYKDTHDFDDQEYQLPTFSEFLQIQRQALALFDELEQSFQTNLELKEERNKLNMQLLDKEDSTKEESRLFSVSLRKVEDRLRVSEERAAQMALSLSYIQEVLIKNVRDNPVAKDLLKKWKSIVR